MANQFARQRFLTGCAHDCGGKCLLVAEVEGGRVVRMRGEPTAMRRHHLEPCVRGLSYAARVHSPDRLQRPLMRSGPRGTGEFRSVTWDLALATIADRLATIRAEAGPGGFLCMGRTGSLTGLLHETRRVSRRFFNLFGGHLDLVGSYSNASARLASLYTYGTDQTGNSRSDWFRSRLLLLWGWDPLVTVMGSHTSWALRECRRRGIPIIAVDPRRTATAALADHWVPIRPGSDVALLNAMAHELIVHGWQDEAFLQQHTLGYAAYRDYLLGREDGVARTPEWQEPITGVPAATARWLAREYGTRHPAALVPGWGPQRSRQGEQFHRATAALAALAGYVGVAGGGAGGLGRGQWVAGEAMLPVGTNPYPEEIPLYRWADCVRRGSAGGYPAQPRAAYIVGGNPMATHADSGKTAQALSALDFVVVHEHFLTPTARYADVVLPATTFLERNDILCPYFGFGGAFYLCQQQAIPPQGQARHDLDIFGELAERLGFGAAYSEERDEEAWLRHLAAVAGIPDYDAFRGTGIHWVIPPGADGDPEGEEPHVAFRAQVEQGAAFSTPSGKIELYSQRLAERNDPLVPPIPRYLDLPEGPTDPGRSRYPLQLLSPKGKRRTNSTLLGPDLDDEQVLTLHPDDAAARGLTAGEQVLVWNDRGACRVPLAVSPGLMPGVALLPMGAWVRWDGKGVDTGGCPNNLTTDAGTAWSQSTTQHTVLVEVAKARR